jgi:hypothetical protein
MNKAIILCTLIAHAASIAAIADNKDLLTTKSSDIRKTTFDDQNPKSANFNALRFTQVPSTQDITNKPSDAKTNQPSEFTCKPNEPIVLEKQDDTAWCGTNHQDLLSKAASQQTKDILKKMRRILEI